MSSICFPINVLARMDLDAKERFVHFTQGERVGQRSDILIARDGCFVTINDEAPVEWLSGRKWRAPSSGS